ncbi:MAG: helix-turn-helix domain-containing protein [Methyloligellaceae bacterium]
MQMAKVERNCHGMLHLLGRSYREIGRIMGRHHTTIMRKVWRNSLKSGYKPGLADHMAWVAVSGPQSWNA